MKRENTQMELFSGCCVLQKFKATIVLEPKLTKLTSPCCCHETLLQKSIFTFNYKHEIKGEKLIIENNSVKS